MYSPKETLLNDANKLAASILQAAVKEAEQLSAKSAESGIPDDFVDKSLTLPRLSENSALFEEEVEIALLPPIDMANWIKLKRNLLYTPDLKILRTAGHWRYGALITVAVSQKTPLLDMLMQMPEVEKVELGVSEKGTNGDYYWNLAFELKPGSFQRTRVYLTLKEEDSISLVQASLASYN